MRKLMIAVFVLGVAAPALSQQAAAPPTADQVTDLQLQLQLTQQQLAGANQNLVASQSQMIRIERQLNEAASDGAKKDAKIKDLEGQVAGLKSTKAAAPPVETPPAGGLVNHPEPQSLPMLPNPPAPNPAADAPK